MEFTLNRDELVAALSRSAAVAEKRSTTPILTCVLIAALPLGGGLRFTATDKALTVVLDQPATVAAPGEVAVSVEHLLGVARSLPSGPVSVRLVDAGRIEVKAGRSTCRIVALPAADFPGVPSQDGVRTMTLASADLRRLLDQSVYASATEDNRYGLNGLHVEAAATDGTVRLVATDGNRLSWSEGPYQGEIGIGRKMLLPRRAAVEIRKLLDGYEGTADLAIGDRAAVFLVPGATLHLRLLEADFPDYRQVMPTGFKRRISLDRSELTTAIKRVSIFATDGAHTVRFAFGADGLVLTARKLDAGDSREDVPADLSGEPITTAFNCRFFLDALASFGGGRVVLELGDVLSPAILRDPDDARCCAVVMPVRAD